MPTYTFTSLNELLSYLQTEIAPNGNREITGQRHRDVVLTMAQSLVAIASNVPPSTVNQFPAYDAGTTYAGGVELIVRHSNKLWLFVSAEAQVGVAPGTNGLVWQEISAAQLAHMRDHDQYLDLGGPYQVSAADLHGLVSMPPSAWIAPVNARNVPNDAAADSSEWTRVIVAAEGATGVFAGHANDLAVKTGGTWVFSDPPAGALVENLSTGNLLIRRAAGGWVEYNVLVPSLAQVMSAGRTTNGALIINGAITRTPIVLSHNAAGSAAPYMANSSAVLVFVSADLVFAPVATSVYGEWRVAFHGLVASDLSFSPTVRFVDGVTPPTSIAAEEVIVMRCSCPSGGTIVVESVGRYYI